MKYFAALFTAFILISCLKNENDENKFTHEKVKEKSDPAAIITPEYFDYSETVLNESIADTAFAYFSEEDTKDLFTLSVPDGNITNTKSVLRITSKEGNILYEHEFTTQDLVNVYDTFEIKTNAQMQHYVIKKAKELLAENSFINPHELAPNDYLNNAPAEELDDYDAYHEILNSNRVLFAYALHEESIYTLGFSISKNKTVSIISCC